MSDICHPSYVQGVTSWWPEGGGLGGSMVMCKSAVKGESLGIQEGPLMDVILTF